MRLSPTLCAALLALLLAGCATASKGTLQGGYDAAKNATAYETRPIPLRMNRSNAMGLQGRQLVTLRAAAACLGRDCAPDEVLLVFSNDGDNETMLNYETLILEADGDKHEWDGLLDRREAVRISPGDFLRLPINRAAFEQIAQAQNVSGTLGGAPFRLSFDQRSPFRDLVLQLGLSQ